MAAAKQQSIPAFDEHEQLLIDEAMKIDHIKAQGVWVRHAALKWATRIVAEDRGITGKVIEVIEATRKH